MNKGTAQGNIEEIELVIKLNSDKTSKLWAILNLNNNSNLYAVRCSKNKPSNISKSLVLPKTDVFIIRTSDRLKLDEFYLNEHMLEEQNINFEYILNSGISVKEKNSRSFTYQKMTIETFFKVFGNYELGCAIEYYTDEHSINKNGILEKAWKTNKKQIKEAIQKYSSKYKYNGQLELETYREIKQTAIALTKHIIDTNIVISDYVFRGIGAFENPFFIDYLYKEGELTTKCYPNKYSITTGSGRSNGSYTVVIKP